MTVRVFGVNANDKIRRLWPGKIYGFRHFSADLPEKIRRKTLVTTSAVAKLFWIVHNYYTRIMCTQYQ